MRTKTKSSPLILRHISDSVLHPCCLVSAAVQPAALIPRSAPNHPPRPLLDVTSDTASRPHTWFQVPRRASLACPPKINCPTRPARPLPSGKSRPHPSATTFATSATPSEPQQSFFFFPVFWDTQGHVVAHRHILISAGQNCVYPVGTSRTFLEGTCCTSSSAHQHCKGSWFIQTHKCHFDQKMNISPLAEEWTRRSQCYNNSFYTQL